ncbi:hypothetical protein GGI23_007420, partial [Coemansia sp. RSA 2559]
YTAGWVSDTLVQASVPYWAVFDALNALYVKSMSSSRSTGGGNSAMADMLAREIASLTTSWIEAGGGQAGGKGGSSGASPESLTGEDGEAPNQSDDSAMPLTAVDEALSQYIINATLANNLELKNELQQVQDHIRHVF